MTENTTTPGHHYPGMNDWPPAPRPAVKPKAWWKKPVVILPVATLVLGLGLGLTNRPDPVTVTVEKPVEKIVTKTITPPECLKAMDLYEQVVSYSSEALGYTKEAMLAASRLDAAGIREQDAKMGELTPKIQAVTSPLMSAKASCRAAGS